MLALDNRSVRVRCTHGGMCSVSRVCCTLQLQSSHLLCCYCLCLDVLPGRGGLRLPVELLSSSLIVHAGATEERPAQHHQDGCRPSYEQGGAKLESVIDHTFFILHQIFDWHWSRVSDKNGCKQFFGSASVMMWQCIGYVMRSSSYLALIGVFGSKKWEDTCVAYQDTDTNVHKPEYYKNHTIRVNGSEEECGD